MNRHQKTPLRTCRIFSKGFLPDGRDVHPYLLERKSSLIAGTRRGFAACPRCGTWCGNKLAPTEEISFVDNVPPASFGNNNDNENLSHQQVRDNLAASVKQRLSSAVTSVNVLLEQDIDDHLAAIQNGFQTQLDAEKEAHGETKQELNDVKEKIRDMEFKLDATEAERDAKEVELAEKTKELNDVK